MLKVVSFKGRILLIKTKVKEIAFIQLKAERQFTMILLTMVLK